MALRQTLQRSFLSLISEGAARYAIQLTSHVSGPYLDFQYTTDPEPYTGSTHPGSSLQSIFSFLSDQQRPEILEVTIPCASLPRPFTHPSSCLTLGKRLVWSRIARGRVNLRCVQRHHTSTKNICLTLDDEKHETDQHPDFVSQAVEVLQNQVSSPSGSERGFESL